MTDRLDRTLERIEPELKALIEEGRRKGFVTVDEVQRMLPDEVTASEKALDRIAQQLDEMGIEMVEEARSFDAGEDGEDDEDEQSARKLRTADVEPSKDVDPLTMPTSAERIDDPVRMYLTQMGEIPLLTREQEIWLAKTIERTRKRYREKLLASGLSLESCIQLLEDVQRGELATLDSLEPGELVDVLVTPADAVWYSPEGMRMVGLGSHGIPLDHPRRR